MAFCSFVQVHCTPQQSKHCGQYLLLVWELSMGWIVTAVSGQKVLLGQAPDSVFFFFLIVRIVKHSGVPLSALGSSQINNLIWLSRTLVSWENNYPNWIRWKFIPAVHHSATRQPNWAEPPFLFSFYSASIAADRGRITWQFCSVTDSAFFTDIVHTHVKGDIHSFLNWSI